MTRLFSGCAARRSFALAMLLIWGSGCGEPASVARRQMASANNATSGELLFDNVVRTLDDLPDAVDLQVRPPMVVLDAAKSSDRRDVMATLGRKPKNPSPKCDYLSVSAQNSDFLSLGVKPGDLVRCYLSDPALAAQIDVVRSPRFRQLVRSGEVIDEAVLQDFLAQEMGNFSEKQDDYIEFTVRRVLDDSHLLLVEGLPIGIPKPVRIEIWRFTDDQMRRVEERLSRFVKSRPVVGWEPSPDEAALQQVVDRLNQWVREKTPDDSWRPDPLIETLPEALQKYASEKKLGEITFQVYDGRLLQESVWLRDISDWARGDSLDAVEEATSLFDWTVRNVQLESRDSLGGLYHRPWQTLLYGRGTMEERAWVFAALCRQRGLDVVILALPDPEHPAERWAWLPALWYDGQLYLFDTRLGLPIPGPKGRAVATLSEVIADEKLLRKLDMDSQHPYPVTATSLRDVAVWVIASPAALSRRMGLIEKQLSGDFKLALTSNASGVAEEVSAAPEVGLVRLWDYPYQTIDKQLSLNKQERRLTKNEFQVFPWRPMLWKGRVLHFQGSFDGNESAQTYYRRARPSNASIARSKKYKYEKELIREGKQDASYWLGLLSYDEGDFTVAEDYLKNRTLKAQSNGPWTDGARYNLARAYESSGKFDDAIKLYLGDKSPQCQGNRLRAEWLKSRIAKGGGEQAATKGNGH